MELLLRGHPNKGLHPINRPCDNVLISTPYERPSLLEGHISGAK